VSPARYREALQCELERHAATRGELHGLKTMNSPAVAGRLREEFEALARRWRDETAHYALASRRIAHDAFLSILLLGRDNLLPLIIEDLRKTHDHWFAALRLLAGGEDPAADATTHAEAVDAWLTWWDRRRAGNVPNAR
jgi:hypothetical protein